MKKHLLLLLSSFVITPLCQAQNPILWGITSTGGPYGNGAGTIFSYNTFNKVETSLHVFGSGSTNGKFPNGSLIKADNGLLYGMTTNGGANNICCNGDGIIFSYDISTENFSDIHDFGIDSDGIEPASDLIQANDGLLYGMTYGGGSYNNPGYGVIFSYNVSNNIYRILHYFGSDSDGLNPNGSLLQASNGLLYGMTASGGTNDVSNGGDGILFSYNISNGIYKILYNFGNGSNGSNPAGSLIQANNGLLYGVTYNGGAYSNGTLFSYNISLNTERDLYDFGKGNDGQEPTGSIMQAVNGLLYGMTAYGGTSIWGTIFSYNISSGTESVLHNFAKYDDSDGIIPQGSLIQTKNGLLYAMTLGGGIYNFGPYTGGTIFSYNISTDTETVLYSFDSDSNGYNPYGDLLEVDSTTGINQLSINNNQLSIYPNPTSGQFTVNLNSNQSGYTLEIYNVMGEKIYQSVLSNSQNNINLSNQPDGMYFVYLKSDERIQVGKVLVTR